MREQWARGIALVTGVVVVLFAIVFALIQNPDGRPPTVVPLDTEYPGKSGGTSQDRKPKLVLVQAGRRIYDALACASCHSIAGQGNLRYPLEGIGARRTADEIRSWIVAADTLAVKPPPAVIKIKQAYRDLPPQDIDALVVYLQSLR